MAPSIPPPPLLAGLPLYYRRQTAENRIFRREQRSMFDASPVESCRRAGRTCGGCLARLSGSSTWDYKGAGSVLLSRILTLSRRAGRTCGGSRAPVRCSTNCEFSSLPPYPPFIPEDGARAPVLPVCSHIPPVLHCPRQHRGRYPTSRVPVPFSDR